MTLKEAFKIGRARKWELDIWWTPISKTEFIITGGTSDYTSVYSISQLANSDTQNTWEVHPEDLKIFEYNNKLNKIINE